MTSVQLCIASVLRLEPSLKTLVDTPDRGGVTNAAVVEICEDMYFWLHLRMLNQVLLPLAEVTMAIQGNNSTLLDVTRYMVYVRNKLQGQLAKIDRGTCASHLRKNV